MIRTLLALTVLTTPAPAAQDLQWTACPGDTKSELECADLPVAIAPGSDRKLTLKVARLPATGEKKGTVMINFGGPQGDQIAIMRSWAKIFTKIRQSMDVVTWDPRGYPGLSEPVLQCDWGPLRTPAFPDDQAGLDRLAAANKARGDRCRSTDPELFDHMDSASDARDAEAVRRALGEDRMNFIGTSYGGTIAQAYARQFPDRVRTMYVDGTGNHSTRNWERELTAIARDHERLMDRFFAWAPKGTERRWRELVARAGKEPIPAPKVKARYDGTQLRFLAVQKGKRGPAEWDALLAAIKAAEGGDASGFAPRGPDPYPALMGGGVKECLDFPRPDSQRKLARTVKRLRKVAPSMGAAFPLAWHAPLTCAGWPAQVANPPSPLPGKLPPMLGAGTWLDYAPTSRVVEQVKGSRMIKFDGPGHNLFAAMANACVIDHVSAYVTTRKLPPRNIECA
ncbi:alpha/beta fold hydrolase [Nonomuraea deserti]|uniref:Alpha/beta fold hydrolase n=1 Tax=Nonomuraea deserti TaxID=1848322 RepID=A0A4V2YBR6_9ACTN|nr:alpha/beta fold hydrolase [Nonomuraea deserti]TDD08686.1 alpha/beta fold hydrolase [Nonomuraea deserti]